MRGLAALAALAMIGPAAGGVPIVFVDDDGDGDGLARIDRGCFERAPNGPDLDGDGAVGFGDLLVLRSAWS